MTDVNIPLLRKAVEWAEAEAAKPYEFSRWNQVTWVSELPYKAPECGTCYCIAGFIVHEHLGISVEDAGGWHETAADALGLSYDGADPLFCANNSIEDVRRIAEEIAGERL